MNSWQQQSIVLKMYKTAIMWLGIWKVKIEHNNKQKTYDFFVVQGNGQALLGMLDTESLNVLTINCNTTYTHKKMNKSTIRWKISVTAQTKCQKQSSLRSAM